MLGAGLWVMLLVRGSNGASLVIISLCFVERFAVTNILWSVVAIPLWFGCIF